VRNELAILEETGFVVQPHVSAGRMPTDTGYRSFVDDLLGRAVADTSRPARELASRLGHAGEVEELMRETSVALTQLTSCLAVVLAPSVSLTRVKRLDLVSIGVRRALFVLITESGQVLNRHVELSWDASAESLTELERALNAALVGKRASEIRTLRSALLQSAASKAAEKPGPLGDRGTSGPSTGGLGTGDHVVGEIIDVILGVLDEADRDRLYHVGVPALLAQPEFHDAEQARPLIEFLEDGIAVLEALSVALGSREMTVRIGHENLRSELGNLSTVATNYGTGSTDGVVGVIGPTRMDYPRAISAVRIVAEGLEDALG
jgi:heat-inducible transcriptional repressor